MKYKIIEFCIRFWLTKVKGITIGSRYIIYRAGFNNSGRESHINIGEITSFSFDRINSRKWEFGVQMKQWGYDLREDHFLEGAYVNWMGSLEDFLNQYNAQCLLKNAHRKVDLSKNPEDFYPILKEINSLVNKI